MKRLRVAAAVTALCIATAALATKSEDATLVKDAKNALAQSLRDPESARFRNLFIAVGSGRAEGRRLVCGEFNAKNGMGGYGGFQRFYSIAGYVGTAEQLPNTFEDRWADYCSHKIMDVK